ncbi:hypothetical protein OIE62_00415 [Streptomyces scopuliridis]|uniref:Uncharacterized protein n=1 Tax=Streptomyces scopuliridis TaxID=452529 RepID=A0ACD4ZYC4_9ACTN|nr:hypothetical protein [Streptomyces scopuliridis]WSC02803.1 hypothetical protein OG835_41415 [Streptomyces scopuliridis]WSC03663.1 hypothetical protein OIE62_00415 [Streptomyces scopuliridis]
MDYGPEDPEHYAKLIRETKQVLDPLVTGGVTIAVTVPGTVEEIKQMNLPLLVYERGRGATSAGPE